MKKLNKMDAVQIASIAGSMLTIAATILNNFADGEKRKKEIDDRVVQVLIEKGLIENDNKK